MHYGKVHQNLSKVFTIFKLTLALITALNIFVQFVSRQISIAMGLFLACTFHYENFPRITSEIYGGFANIWWVKIFMTSYAATGYLALFFFESTTSFSLASLYFTYFLVGVLLAWPIGSTL